MSTVSRRRSLAKRTKRQREKANTAQNIGKGLVSAQSMRR